MSSVADVLEKAAEKVAEGWTQRVFETQNADGSFCYCAMGAVFAAASGLPVGKIDHNLASAVASALGFPNAGELSDWNDADERTQSEVVSKLREAAAKAREQGL